MNSRTYRVGRSSIQLIFGDITSSTAEVIVSSDDFCLSMGGGVSRAISLAAGGRLRPDTSKMVPARLGDVIVTSAGELPAKYIFHAITIGAWSDDLPPDAIVRLAVRKSIRLLSLLGCRSIAFPAIGTGVAGIPPDIAASEMAAELFEASLFGGETYKVELYVAPSADETQTQERFTAFERHLENVIGVRAAQSGDEYAIEPPPSPTYVSPGSPSDAHREREIFDMLRRLDARRAQLENQLAEALGVGAPLDEIKNQLGQVWELRQGYMTELDFARRRQVAGQPGTVFLSSTYLDLKPYREALRSLIERLQLGYVGMEEFTPTKQPPATLIRAKVEQSEGYLGVLGMRYGHVDPATGYSMTELEYRQAVASGKQIWMFVMHPQASITPEMVEPDPASFKKLLDFKAHVQQAHTCQYFRDVEHLVREAERTLKAVQCHP